MFFRTHSLPLFEAAKHSVRRPWNLAPITPEEFAKTQAWLSNNCRAGFMLASCGELVNLFNCGAPGLGRAAARFAISLGATHLNCYDGFLVEYYKSLGFVEVVRLLFDDQVAPAGWQYTALGRPDVVFMALPQHVSSQTFSEVAHAVA